MTSLEHLMYMGTHGYVTNNDNTSLLSDQNLRRLQGLPILFIHGSDNVVYSPESTDKSFTKLTTLFGQGNYDREVIAGYGHLDCWMSPEAVDDVYPLVYEHAVQCYAKGKGDNRIAVANGQANGH
jgi:pimeloyl-ACP methyl ester carboxylesterase